MAAAFCQAVGGSLQAQDLLPEFDSNERAIPLRRDPELIQKLLLKLEEYPSRPGDMFILNGAEPELALDGYSAEQTTYHLEQLREMGLIDSPGSQPMIGVTFRGLSSHGHDFLEWQRARLEKKSDNPRSFSRQLIIAATDVLKTLGHNGFDRQLLELALSDKVAGIDKALMARATSLSNFALQFPEFRTPEGKSVAEAIVDRAANVFKDTGAPSLTEVERRTFTTLATREGILLEVGEKPQGEIVKRDNSLIQELLQTLEAAPTDRGFSFEQEEATKLNRSLDDIRYNLQQAEDMGLIEVGSKPLNGEWKILRLTPRGHDFINPYIVHGTITIPSPAAVDSQRKVFIVHGHDEAAREAVARFLEKIGFEVIILHERANKGKTIIEKFEANGDVGFVVVLLTPDDIGGPESGAQAHRVRQNVILEWGYFIGRLGRDRVCALKKGNLELPSDIIGVVWEEFDEHGGWKGKLAKELSEANFAIDWSRVH
jgi:predicted nucleotide-binding protein